MFHSDLKPDNFLLFEDDELDNTTSKVFRWRIKVSDFGLSRLASESGCVDVVLTRVGTTLFMAPEMVHPGSKSARYRVGRPCDVWALGVI